MSRELPTVARWLLDRFGIPHRNEPLMGDLVEEYASSRSAFWFWRQTATAILTTVVRDIRNHKLLALRAIATGWLLMLAWALVAQLIRPPSWSYGLNWNRWQLFELFQTVSMVLCPTIIGCIVASTHKAQQGAMVLVYVVSLLIHQTADILLHYSEINRWAERLSVVGCLVIFILIGGFLSNPSRPFQSKA